MWVFHLRDYDDNYSFSCYTSVHKRSLCSHIYRNYTFVQMAEKLRAKMVEIYKLSLLNLSTSLKRNFKFQFTLYLKVGEGAHEWRTFFLLRYNFVDNWLKRKKLIALYLIFYQLSSTVKHTLETCDALILYGKLSPY